MSKHSPFVQQQSVDLKLPDGSEYKCIPHTLWEGIPAFRTWYVQEILSKIKPYFEECKTLEWKIRSIPLKPTFKPKNEDGNPNPNYAKYADTLKMHIDGPTHMKPITMYRHDIGSNLGLCRILKCIDERHHDSKSALIIVCDLNIYIRIVKVRR